MAIASCRGVTAILKTDNEPGAGGCLCASLHSRSHKPLVPGRFAERVEMIDSQTWMDGEHVLTFTVGPLQEIEVRRCAGRLIKHKISHWLNTYTEITDADLARLTAYMRKVGAI